MCCQSRQKTLSTMACLFVGLLTCRQVINSLYVVHLISCSEVFSRNGFGPKRLLKLLGHKMFNY